MKKSALIFIIIIVILIALYIISIFGALLQSWVMNHTAQAYVSHPNPIYLFLHLTNNKDNFADEQKNFCDKSENPSIRYSWTPEELKKYFNNDTEDFRNKSDKDCLLALKYKSLYCSSLKKDYRKNCYGDITGFYGDLSYCEKYGCDFEYVFRAAEKNPEVCEDPLVNEFKYQCNIFAAQGSQNIEYCNKIEDQKYKDQCYYNFVLYHDTHEICEDIETQNFKENCLVNRAVTNNDADICRHRISTEHLKETCLYNIAKSTANFEICDELTTDIRIGNCFYEKAKQLQDVESCRKIPKDNSRFSCFSKLAALDKNISYCDEIIDDESRKDNCIKNYATENEDLEACEKIISEYKKDECLGKEKNNIINITP